MNQKEINYMSHAIGLDNKKPYKRHGKLFYKPYRNYYEASLVGCKIWDNLVVKKYANAGKKNRNGSRTYWLTRKGMDVLGEKLGIVIHDEEE